MTDSSNVWNGSGDDDEKQKVSSNGFQRQYKEKMKIIKIL